MIAKSFLFTITVSLLLVLHLKSMESPVCLSPDLQDLQRAKSGPPSLDQFNDIRLSYNNIRSIDGIESFIVTYKEKETMLKDVPNLEISLMRNNIEDVKPLATLSNLEALFLYDNKIRDIWPLAFLLKLKYLSLSQNQITDVRPLASLTRLYDLGLSNNKIIDISPLSSLSCCYLDLSNNEVKDIIPLSFISRLDYLTLSNNIIGTIDTLRVLTRLTALDLSNNNVKDIRPLCTLIFLRDLIVSNNQIIDVPENFTNLTRLAFLDLSHNKLTKFPAKLVKLILPQDGGLLSKLKQFLSWNNKPSTHSLSELKQIFIWNNKLGPLQSNGEHKPVQSFSDITFDSPLPTPDNNALAVINKVLNYGDYCGPLMLLLPRELLIELSKYRKRSIDARY